jgi:oligoendopeptidase F
VRVPFEQAREWVLAAFRPLGADYVAAVESAFRERWIDVYENRGKRSGAYASGCYDGHPYVLMNYQGTLDDVFTLAHELGHAMHSWLANRAQPHRFARYAIFVAEIASTANEELLLRHLLGTTADPAFRAYLLNHLCDAFKGTVYRQTMFAEFEKRVHEMDARATPLTPDELTRAYYELNREYYGPDVDADPKIGVEWSRIPHFYYQFYVYKYATSFCAAQIFAERIASGVPARDAYLGLLRAGGSDDPLALIARAGVDLLDRATIEGAFHRFDGTVRELGALLG